MKRETPKPSRVLRAAGRRLRRLGDALLTLLLVRQPPRRHCPECAVDFAPALTAQCCPICGWTAPETPRRPVTAPPRVPAGMRVVWFFGLVLFALVAHALYS